MVVHLSSKRKISSRSKKREKTRKQLADRQNRFKIRLSLAEPFLKPTLPLFPILLRLHIRRWSLPKMSIGRRRARRSTTPPGVRDGRWRRREILSMPVQIRAAAKALEAILCLGTFIEPLLLQSLLLQLVHGAVEAAQVCWLSVGIGVARAGARHGGDVVIGALVVLLLVGRLPAVAVAVGIGALIRRHARGVARAPAVAILIVGIVVIGGLTGTAVGINHAVWAGLGIASVVTVLVAVSAG